MSAEPPLNRIANVFAEHRLEAVMVGNAAAALHGAPVTTMDIDFMFRKTPANLKKLKAVAHTLQAVILKPYYPVSDLFRVSNDDQGIQLDFMSRLHGIHSFEGLGARSTSVQFSEHSLNVACLADIIKSKRATTATVTGPFWTLFRKRSMNKKKTKARQAQEAALKKESERSPTKSAGCLLYR
jgi:hypothetical protein